MRVTLRRRPRIGRNQTGSRTEPKAQLTNEQWDLVKNLFPYQRTTAAGGRPPVQPRPCLEGVLWILRTGARWKDLPLHFPSPCTCWRRLKQWTESGVFQKAWARLLNRYHGLKKVNWEESIADGTFSPAKKGVPR